MKFNWITIKVNKFEESKKFYGNYLGMKIVEEFSPNESMSIVFFAADNGMKIELIYENNSKVETFNNGNVSIGVSSEDYDNLLTVARSKKIITVEPTILGGHLECFFVADPNGINIQIARENIANN